MLLFLVLLWLPYLCSCSILQETKNMKQELVFFKYQGTGNDFVLLDNREGSFPADDEALIRALCHRRFGVGADGLMLLEDSEKQRFSMRYFNSDGRESSMCGNGGRCMVAFAFDLGLVEAGKSFSFEAIDGLHEAVYAPGAIRLKMVDVHEIKEMDGDCFLNTGSPHLVRFCAQPEQVDVPGLGRALRNDPAYGKGGCNVNFVGRKAPGFLQVRTYERGVEEETWSCGTGCVAAVLSDHFLHGETSAYRVAVKGGELQVSFVSPAKGRYSDIWLEGPARFVFRGSLDADALLKQSAYGF